MSTRNEIKAVLRENTKKAFELMEQGIKASGKKEFTANELANMTDDRLSTKSVAGFLRSNCCNFSVGKIGILDTASYNSDGGNVNITIFKYKTKTKHTTKTYVNVENENDVITIKRREMFYIFD